MWRVPLLCPIATMSLLSCFDDLPSLSRAEVLAQEVARQCSSLEEALSAAEAAMPAALERASSEATESLRALEVADKRRAAAEEAVRSRMLATTRLAARLEPPRAQLQRLRDAHLLLHVLVTADELAARVETANQTASEQPPAMGGRTAAMEALLRLHALRVSVRAAVDDADRRCGAPVCAHDALTSAALTAVDCSASACSASACSASACSAGAADNSEAAPAEAAPAEAATLAVLELLDERVAALGAQLRSPFAARASRALGALGWPSKLEATCLVRSSPGFEEVRAALSELVLLQHCCESGAGWQASRMERAGGAAGAERVQVADGWSYGRSYGRPYGRSSGQPHGRLDGPMADEGAEEVVGEEEPSSAEGLWAVDALAAPVLRRFRYHFEGRRETNRRDKPEWVFSHVASLLRLHESVLRATLDPILGATPAAVAQALGAAIARL